MILESTVHCNVTSRLFREFERRDFRILSMRDMAGNAIIGGHVNGKRRQFRAAGSMEQLKRIYGTPHEMLHILALMLIGRRAVHVAQDHVIIPGDLTTGQYVFVAGLPALLFFVALALGAVGLLSARTPSQAGIAVGVIIAAGFAAAGTLGDVQLIMMKLAQKNRKP